MPLKPVTDKCVIAFTADSVFVISMARILPPTIDVKLTLQVFKTLFKWFSFRDVNCRMSNLQGNLREFVKSLEILVNRLGLCVKLLAGKTCFYFNCCR